MINTTDPNEGATKLKRIIAGQLHVNTYVFSRGSRAIIIDPAGDGSKLIQYLQFENLNPELILLTHGHWDHIEGIKKVKQLYDVPVAIHNNDAKMLQNAELNLSTWTNCPFALEQANVFLDEDNYTHAEIRYRVIHTPGHSPGSICVIIGKYMVTGDTLFKHSVGRCDFPGSDMEDLINSITKLSRLPDYEVLPGHGDLTSLSYEKCTNPYMKRWCKVD